jgi:hypothetical protein
MHRDAERRRFIHLVGHAISSAAATALAGSAWYAQGDDVKQSDDNYSMVTVRPIGIISTPFQEPAGTPIQPSRAKGAFGTVRVREEFAKGLQDLAGFERIWFGLLVSQGP